jgi:hypothetical protein
MIKQDRVFEDTTHFQISSKCSDETALMCFSMMIDSDNAGPYSDPMTPEKERHFLQQSVPLLCIQKERKPELHSCFHLDHLKNLLVIRSTLE